MGVKKAEILDGICINYRMETYNSGKERKGKEGCDAGFESGNILL